MRAVLPILLASVLAAACAGTPPPPRTHYLMRATLSEGVSRAEAPVAIALGSVQVAPYLSEQGLVLEIAANEVQSARHHLWAEPLGASLRLYLRTQISNELGYEVSANATPGGALDYRVDVSVEELHGTLSGAARLVASWRIARGGEADELAAFRFVRTRSLEQDGYSALAAADVELVGELAAAIAKSLTDVAIPSAAP
jgi:uncharacterized lipoprotein YmbA